MRVPDVRDILSTIPRRESPRLSGICSRLLAARGVYRGRGQMKMFLVLMDPIATVGYEILLGSSGFGSLIRKSGDSVPTKSTNLLRIAKCH